MIAPSDDGLVLHADGLIDGRGNRRSPASVVVLGRRIAFVGSAGDAEGYMSKETPGLHRVDLPGATLLPGLIDVHAHAMFGEPFDSYEGVMGRDGDGVLLLRATANVGIHLRAGVTTMRDNGARGRVAFDLREGVERGYVPSPRLLVSGRPITMTGGHFHFCGEEADSERDVRAAVRRLVTEGADHIKIMASGGGTEGTDPTKPSYAVRELRAIVDEAHRLGRRTTAHCAATGSIVNVLAAGVDMIEHAAFMGPDGAIALDAAVADRIGHYDVPVCPTLGVEIRKLARMRSRRIDVPNGARADVGRPRVEPVPDPIGALERTIERRREVARRLWADHGVTLVTGTDAVAGFGDYHIDMEALGDTGMSPMEVISASTSEAARVLGVSDRRGAIAVGMDADIIAVEGNPLTDLRAMRQIRLVVLDGIIVHAREPTDGSGYDTG